MEYNAQDIAAIWFMVVFSAPIAYWACKAVWNLPRKTYDCGE